MPRETENFLDTVGFFDSLLVQLIVCIIVDVTFVLDNFLIGVGEVLDVPQAFVQVILIELMMGKEKGASLFEVYAFVEEIIPVPFLDLFPICTISFIYKVWVMSR